MSGGGRAAIESAHCTDGVAERDFFSCDYVHAAGGRRRRRRRCGIIVEQIEDDLLIAVLRQVQGDLLRVGVLLAADADRVRTQVTSWLEDWDSREIADFASLLARFNASVDQSVGA